MEAGHRENDPLLRHETHEHEADAADPALEQLLDVKLDQDRNIRWRHESRIILTYSTQLSGTYLLQYLYNLIIILVVSRLGRDELAAVSIGIATMNIIGFAIFEGMATSLDTLCSQAYGSGNLKHVGLHVQKMALFMLLVAIPIGTLWLCSPWILVHLVPQPQLVGPASTFLRITLIGLPGYGLFEAGKRFVQAQGDFIASLIVLIVCAPINVLLNWLFVFKLQWSVAGAALAAALTNNIRAILLYLYIIFVIPASLRCWSPLSSAVLKNWGPMVRLSIAGSVMTLCEWAPFEVLTFSTSYLGTAELAAQTLLATITVLIWHIPLSASIAVSTRIGHLVGAGALHICKQLAKVYAALFLCLGLFEMALLLTFRDLVASIFTKDLEVRKLVKDTIPIASAFVIFDATTCFAHGVMRGLGRQGYAGWVTFSVNFFYTIPMAIFLELGSPHLGLSGVWISTTTCLIMVMSAEVLIMKCMSWEKCIEEAKEREAEPS